MKGICSLIPLALSALVISTASQAADEAVTASAVWKAEADKNTTNNLVVTPMRALQFKYAPAAKDFNTDTGTFEVALKGDHSTSTAFKLEARVDDTNNILRQVGGKSTLQIGALFGSTEVGSSNGGTAGGVSASNAWTTLLDSTKDIGAGSALWALTRSAGSKDPLISARDNFKFIVKKATLDGSTAEADLSKLPDAMWQGEVAVAFRATWATPAGGKTGS